MRLLQRVLVRLHAIEKPQHTLLISLLTRLLDSRARRRCVAVSLLVCAAGGPPPCTHQNTEQGKQHCGRKPRSTSLHPALSPRRRERGVVLRLLQGFVWMLTLTEPEAVRPHERCIVAVFFRVGPERL